MQYASPSGPVAGRGPIGELRNPLAVLGLSIITLGIYGIYWQFKSYDEIKLYSGQGLGGGVGLLIALVCGILTPFLLAADVEKLYRSDGQESPVTAATGAWVLLPLAGGIIWLFKVQGALNDFWLARGATERP